MGSFRKETITCGIIGVEGNAKTGELTLLVATSDSARHLEIRVSPENVRALRYALVRLEEGLAQAEDPEPVASEPPARAEVLWKAHPIANVLTAATTWL